MDMDMKKEREKDKEGERKMRYKTRKNDGGCEEASSRMSVSGALLTHRTCKEVIAYFPLLYVLFSLPHTTHSLSLTHSLTHTGHEKEVHLGSAHVLIRRTSNTHEQTNCCQ